MTDQETKKPGLFGRLFGRGSAQPVATPASPARSDEHHAPASPARSDEHRAPASPARSDEHRAPAEETRRAKDGASASSEEQQATRCLSDRAEQEVARGLSDGAPQELAPAEEAARPVEENTATIESAVPAVPVEEVAAPVAAPAIVAPPPAPTPVPEAPSEKRSWFERLRQGLRKTSTQLTQGIAAVFTKRKLDAATLEELEDLLIQADLGLDTSSRIIDRLSDGRYNKEISASDVSNILAEEVEKVLAPVAKPLVLNADAKPHVILMIGVNGTGKTTTIGKLSRIFASDGKRVMLAAGDTFRAAAVEQLKVWGERTGAPVVTGANGADAAGLAFDAFKRARDEGADVLIIDTAGRLQNKAHLMAELEKIVRVIKKLDSNAPHSVLLTLDATTGQNALNQVEVFRQAAGVTGLIMTKLDGTARGGILVAIAAKFGLPVHAIGVGESVEDLQPFAPKDFARAIAGVEAAA